MGALDAEEREVDMAKRMFGRPRTKLFNHKRYYLVWGSSSAAEANRKAVELRRSGQLARVSPETNELGETKYAVWANRGRR